MTSARGAARAAASLPTPDVEDLDALDHRIICPHCRQPYEVVGDYKAPPDRAQPQDLVQALPTRTEGGHLMTTTPDRQRAARITLAVLTEDKAAANAAITETAEDGRRALARVVAVLAGDLAALIQMTHGDDAADNVRRYLLDLAAHE